MKDIYLWKINRKINFVQQEKTNYLGSVCKHISIYHTWPFPKAIDSIQRRSPGILTRYTSVAKIFNMTLTIKLQNKFHFYCSKKYYHEKIYLNLNTWSFYTNIEYLTLKLKNIWQSLWSLVRCCIIQFSHCCTCFTFCWFSHWLIFNYL